jgi:hypothetical protein
MLELEFEAQDQEAEPIHESLEPNIAIGMDAVCPRCDSRGLEGRPQIAEMEIGVIFVCRRCGHADVW